MCARRDEAKLSLLYNYCRAKEWPNPRTEIGVGSNEGEGREIHNYTITVLHGSFTKL